VSLVCCFCVQELTYKYNVGGKWHLARSDTAAADMQVGAADIWQWNSNSI
jgi:hypothetical protein